MIMELARWGARSVLSAPVLPRLAGPRPRSDRGVALDREIHLMLGVLSLARRPTLDQLGAVRARAEMRRQAGLAAMPTGPLERVEDRTIAGPGGDLPLRVYTPRAPWAAARPALLYLHGGGFVLGDLDSHDGLCRFFAERAGVVVVAVDYRLAPEHPFPAAVEDALAAYRWLRDAAPSLSIDPSRIAVGGDSAGGNLAAVLCQQLLAARVPLPAFQLLIYPATDLSRSFDSHRTFAEGFYLERPTIDWFLANYLTDPKQESDPRGSPIVTRELAGLPPAHVAVAGFDPLRDEGEAYARALMAAGVPTSLRCHESLIHGFASMGGVIEAARWAIEDMALQLRTALTTRASREPLAPDTRAVTTPE